MPSNDSPSDPLPNLIAALESQLTLAPCANVAALCAARPAAHPAIADPGASAPAGTTDPAPKKGSRFVVDRPIRIGNYYDLQPAITIYDPDLGTLAFVEHIRRGTESAHGAAWRAIECATAVRQILIDEAAREQQALNANAERERRPLVRVLPLQVELVLLVSGLPPTTGPDPVRTCLTDVARQTGYLRLVGVSVLDLAQHPVLDADVLRRAFPWLLRGTSRWFDKFSGVVADSPWRTGDQPVTLTLQDYRLPGTRHFSCRGNAWLHLVHGHNGSGKSSIAEAVELVLTTEIQRLKDAAEADYFRIVRHRPFGTDDKQLAALGPCSVALHANASQITKVLIESGKKPERDGQPPREVLQTNSFRMDQVFMDKLIRSQAAGRAALFLNAFSPGGATVLERLQQLRNDVRRGWANLPDHVRRKAATESAAARSGTGATATTTAPLTAEEEAAFVVRELGALYPSAGPSAAEPAKAALSPAGLESLLPIGRNELVRLAQIHPPIQERMDALLGVAEASALADALAQFETSLNMVRSPLPLHIADLHTALRVFQEFRAWNVGRRGPAGDFETHLRQWLELQALVDLTTRYSGVVAAVEGALAHNWFPNERDTVLASAGKALGGAAALTKRSAELADELAEARRRVEASSESEPDASAAASAPTRRWLLPAELDSLNRVDQFLRTTRGNEPLGVRFNRALASGHEESLAEGTIGRSGGLEQAIEEVVDMKLACEALQQASAAAATTGADRNQLTADLVKAARELQQQSSELPKNFFYRLAGSNKDEREALSAAFNELLALMTPARWAYRDIRLRADLPEGSPQLALQTAEGAPAELLFNTAELNASALVLFLLLAPRLPNDLKLLVLDDPLQNMDELTVITLGRALAKLRVFYPKAWTVLAFFHGEENVTRIRDEAPCVVYHLPWLQTAATGETTIEALPGDDDCRWQALTPNVIADPPERASRVELPRPASMSST